MKTEQTRPTVLVVNDDPKVLELLTVILEQEEYKVLTAQNAPAALEIAFTSEPDIVISDVVMPEMDGLELCRRLKQNPRTAYVPVLLASALRTGKRSNFNALTAGADDYLELPFRRQELLIKVVRLTERHRIERRYREIVEQAADIIYTHDLQGNFTSLNKTGERITGYSREEALQMNIAEVVVPEQLHRAREMIARKATTDDATVYELEIFSKEGRRVPLEVSTRLIYEGGAAVGVQGIARDVTERKRVEAELQASEAELRALFAAMPDVILVLDAEGRYRKVAPTNPKLLYKPPAELIGKTLHEVFPLAQADTFLGHIQRALRMRQPVNIEYSLTIEDREVWFEGAVSPMMEDSVIWVARDITERKRAQQALEQQVEREAVVNRISSAVRRSLDITEVFRTAVRELGTYLAVDRCAIFMKDESAGRLRLAAEYHAPGVRPPEPDFPLSRMKDLIDGIDRQGALAFDDVANDERVREIYDRFLRASGVRSIMSVGIRAGDEMPGAFAFSTTRSLRHWRE